MKFKPQYRRLLYIDRLVCDGTYLNCTSLSVEWEASTRTMQRDIDMESWILSLGEHVEVLKPATLRTKVASRHQAAATRCHWIKPEKSSSTAPYLNYFVVICWIKTSFRRCAKCTGDGMADQACQHGEKQGAAGIVE